MTREQNQAIAILLPQAAREIRAQLEGGHGDPLRYLDKLDALLKSEAEIQTAAVALLRRRELASPHAGPIAQAILDEASRKQERAKSRGERSGPPPAWAVDVAANSRPLPGGIVAVWWTAAGNNLSPAQAGRSQGLGLMPGIPDLEVLAEGAGFHIEMKSKRGRLGLVQAAVASVFTGGAGRRVYECRSVCSVAEVLVGALGYHIRTCADRTPQSTT